MPTTLEAAPLPRAETPVAEPTSTPTFADAASIGHADRSEFADRAEDVACAVEAARRRAIASLFRRSKPTHSAPTTERGLWTMDNRDQADRPTTGTTPARHRSRLGDALCRLETSRVAAEASR